MERLYTTQELIEGIIILLIVLFVGYWFSYLLIDLVVGIIILPYWDYYKVVVSFLAPAAIVFGAIYLASKLYKIIAMMWQ